jgi:ATP-dependent Clp protease ATP-binding subunit ClpC
MLERFTDRARSVIKLAQEEVEHFGHSWFGTEHLLLGILKQEDNLAAKTLSIYGVDFDKARAELEKSEGKGSGLDSSSHIPFTPRAKRVLELALSEANSLHVSYIGPEHLLLGIERLAEGGAVGILSELDVSLKHLHQTIYGDLLSRPGARTPDAQRSREDIERDISRTETSLELLRRELEALG